MRILFLADCNSSHTKKWAYSLRDRGLDVGVFALSVIKQPEEYINRKISVFSSLDLSDSDFQAGVFAKTRYIKAVMKLKSVLKSFKPDIVHTHYASSYGLLGALSGFHPLVTSVWGTDVFDFPDSGYIQKKILQFNLSRADVVLSTSHVMKERTSKFTDKKIYVTPFGIDPSEFDPVISGLEEYKDRFVIGIIKSMEEQYGITYLIRAFEVIVSQNPDKPLHLLLVGSGSMTDQYKALVAELGLSEMVTFAGRIDHDMIPAYHQTMDIFVNPSLWESFGVSVVEAMAMKKPVVVSEVGGLKEVVRDSVNGLYVKPEDTDSIVSALQKLIGDPELRRELGEKARAHVVSEYNWNNMIGKVIDEIYRPLC